MDDLLFVLCCIFFVLHSICMFIDAKYDNPFPGLILCFTFVIVLFLYALFDGGSVLCLVSLFQ